MDINQLIPKLGTNFGIGGIVFTGAEGSVAVILPDEDRIDIDYIVYPTAAEWERLLRQTDLVEVEIVNKNGAKAVLRKSERQISQNVSWAVYARDGYSCVYCGSGGPLTVDHIILWEDNGPSVAENLVSCCRVCNKMRGNTQISDWLESDAYRKRSSGLSDERLEANRNLVNVNVKPLTRRRSR